LHRAGEYSIYLPFYAPFLSRLVVTHLLLRPMERFLFPCRAISASLLPRTPSLTAMAHFSRCINSTALVVVARAAQRPQTVVFAAPKAVRGETGLLVAIGRKPFARPSVVRPSAVVLMVFGIVVAVSVVAGATCRRLVEALVFVVRHFQRLLALIELFLPMTIILFVMVVVSIASVLIISRAFAVKVPPLTYILLANTHCGESASFAVIGA